MLELKGLLFSFQNKVVFEALNLTFQSNKIIGIVGKNGVGKTTLFRCISGIYTPAAGEMRFDRMPFSKQQVGFLPTDPFFYTYMTGGEYLQLVNGKTANHYADLLDLPLNELIDTYSTGMRKKLAFSAIISQRRPIQILDEPFNGVDLESNEILKHIIQNEKYNKITLISSHVLSTLTDICDEIYFIKEGFQCDYYTKNNFNNLHIYISEDIKNKLEAINTLKD